MSANAGSTDNAIFTSKMNHLGANVADVVLPMGLNPKYLGAFVGALTSRNNAALLRIPGATPQMAGAAAEAMLKTYASGFQAVWIAAGCFVALATICKSNFLIVSRPLHCVELNASTYYLYRPSN